MALPAAVEAIGEIHFEGNVIPHTWFESPLLRFSSGKPNTVAILLLADLVYWYRPTVIREEETGRIVEIRKKFAEDKLQKHYDKWAEQFGFTKRQTQDACHFLRDAGLITIEARTVELKGRQVGNVLYFEPVPAMIQAITFRRTPSYVKTEKGSRSNGSPPPMHRRYTENSVENTNKETLPFNVGEPDPAPTTNDNALANMRRDAIEAVVRLTGDTKSRRRFAQLFGICEESGHWSVWDEVLAGLRRRLMQTEEPLERPGAYFCKILSNRLLERGISVPVGSKAERDEVKRQVRESLA